jgi:enoyl-CoA hydratase
MPVRVERLDRVLTVIHSRPEARNAVDPEHAEALYHAFLAFDGDDAADVAVLWGEGRAFSAGVDLKKLATRDPTRPSPLEFPKDGGPVPRGPMGPTRLRLGKPVIAAIEGPAVAGGMELALWADCRVMAAGAYMGIYNRRWGVPLSDGGTVRLPRLVGQGCALEIIMTGRKVEAQECLRIGLCEKGRAPGPGTPGCRGDGARNCAISSSVRARRPPLRLFAAWASRARRSGA